MVPLKRRGVWHNVMKRDRSSTTTRSSSAIVHPRVRSNPGAVAVLHPVGNDDEHGPNARAPLAVVIV